MDSVPGYYNHCAVCGRTAAGHHANTTGEGSGYSEPEHEFVMLPDERMMASHVPIWRDFWALQDRVDELDARLKATEDRLDG